MSEWDRAAIRRTLVKHLQVKELRVVIFDLGIEETGATDIDDVALHILKRLAPREGEFQPLEAWVRDNRPDLGTADWHGTPPPAVDLPLPTIDREDAIAWFHRLMRGDAGLMVYRLLGEAKMGKTHLMTDVFPLIAEQQYQARCAVVKFNRQLFSAPAVLHALATHLGERSRFPMFFTAYRQWVARFEAIGGMVTTTRPAESDREEVERSWELRLTTALVGDLVKLQVLTVLLFDAVNTAAPQVQKWLVSSFLPQLTLPNANIRVVVAGQDIPVATSSYLRFCCEHRLERIVQRQPYLAYCRERGISLNEQDVESWVERLEGSPGLFVEMLPTLIGGDANG